MVSRIAHGTYRLRGEKCYENVKSALLMGYRTIDTADLYKNHSEVGRAVNDILKETTIKREDIIITSKIHNKNQESDDVYESCHRLIKELGLDYVDIMLLHSSVQGKSIKSYTDLIRVKTEGLIKQIGVSNFDIDDLKILLDEKMVPYLNQIELSIFFQRKELVDFCKKNNIIVQAHSCLTNKSKLDDERLVKSATELGISSAELMILWCLKNDVCVVVGCPNGEHMQNNLLLQHKTDLLGENNFDSFDEKFFIYKKYIK
jgi:diketogulonate reductase-like aldo/keto reductase